jgi:hypothetical protein
MNTRSWLTRIVIASAIVVGASAVPSAAFAGGPAVPFTDPGQAGSLTLCNQHDQPVTSGSLLTVPFVWRVVSSGRAPTGYTQATLVVFQPIQYEAPGDWSGYELTDDSIFSNPAHPMAQATYADAPLIWADQSIPPYWDGYYQLRLVFSAPNQVPWEATYPTAIIKVSGNSWTEVQGGGASCGAGTAVSVASLLLPKSETAVPKPPAKVVPYSATKKGNGTKGASATPAAPQTSSGGSTTGSGSGSHSAAAAALGPSRQAAGARSGGSPVAAVVAGSIAALLLAGLASLVVVRRRRATSTD